MVPAIGAGIMGWDAPVRSFLIAIGLVGGSALVWASTGPPVPLMAPVALSVDANSAPVPVLLALPGLGPVLAGRIAEGRPYRSLADLDRRVKGIGPAKSGALRPFLRFEASQSPHP